MIRPEKRAAAAVTAAAAVMAASSALAGPPFVTDDPEPTDTGRWEIYNFAAGAGPADGLAGQAGFDLNYGGHRDLQLTAVIPIDYDTGPGRAVGLGDIQLAAKYRILRQGEGRWTPDVAVFPRLFLPTAQRGLESDRLSLLLPVWAQKDFGPWSLFGGGGYQINPGPGRRNFWLTGLAVQRTVDDRLSLGAEVYHQTPGAPDAKPFTGVNLGLTYRLVEHWSLLAAGGPGVENAREGGRYDFYVALKADY
jgi:hypothetical protein